MKHLSALSGRDSFKELLEDLLTDLSWSVGWRTHSHSPGAFTPHTPLRKAGDTMNIVVADDALIERHIHDFGRLLSEQTIVPPWNLRWKPGNIDDPESATGFLHMLHVNGGRFVVALNGETIAGVGVTICLSCEELLDDLHVRELGAQVGDEYLAAVVVDPGQRKHGVFTQLAELRVKLARERAAASRNGHMPIAWVRTHPEVQPVIRVYSRMGFEFCGEYSPPLGGVCAPRVVMKMPLDAVTVS